MQVLRAVIRGVVILIAASLLPSANASATPPVARLVHVYTYDLHLHNAPSSDDVHERAPPAACTQTATHDTVDRWSHGASAGSSGPLPVAATTYDDSNGFAQVAQVTSTTDVSAIHAQRWIHSSSSLPINSKRCSRPCFGPGPT